MACQKVCKQGSTQIVYTSMQLSVMCRSCAGPKSDGSWKMALSSVKTETGCSITTSEECNRFATLEVMDIILVNGI